MRLNWGATIGCVIGAIIGYAIAGPLILIPLLIAILLYNYADVQITRKRRLKT